MSEAYREFTIDQWVAECHRRSDEAGWWPSWMERSTEVYASKIALIHSEVSEMLEGLRKGLHDDHLPDRMMEEVEAADIAIRLFDYCGARNINLLGAIIEKLEYNAQRADHKPENRAKEGGKSI